MHTWLSWIWRTGAQALQGHGDHEASDQLSDFTTTRQVLLLSTMAIIIGVFSAFVALALLRLIGLFTNLFFSSDWRPPLSRRPTTRSGCWRCSYRSSAL